MPDKVNILLIFIYKLILLKAGGRLYCIATENACKRLVVQPQCNCVGHLYRCRRISSKTSSFGGTLAQPSGVAFFLCLRNVKRTAKTAGSPGSNKLLLRRKITAFSRFGALSAADPGNGLPAHVTNIHFCEAGHARRGAPPGQAGGRIGYTCAARARSLQAFDFCGPAGACRRNQACSHAYRFIQAAILTAVKAVVRVRS